MQGDRAGDGWSRDAALGGEALVRQRLERANSSEAEVMSWPSPFDDLRKAEFHTRWLVHAHFSRNLAQQKRLKD
jgi:hypothetical protein